MTKQATRYEVREYVGSSYSKALGRRLRTRTEALRVVRWLKKDGRAAFAAALTVSI